MHLVLENIFNETKYLHAVYDVNILKHWRALSHFFFAHPDSGRINEFPCFCNNKQKLCPPAAK